MNENSEKKKKVDPNKDLLDSIRQSLQQLTPESKNELEITEQPEISFKQSEEAVIHEEIMELIHLRPEVTNSLLILITRLILILGKHGSLKQATEIISVCNQFSGLFSSSELKNPLVSSLIDQIDEMQKSFSPKNVEDEVGEVEPISSHERIEEKLFTRGHDVKDQWDLIARSDRLIEQYRHLSHLTYPLFCRLYLLELHRYSISPNEDNRKFQLLLEIPSEIIINLITILIRKAPCSSLLQILKRIRETKIPHIEDDYQFSDIDRKEVQKAVKKYFYLFESVLEASTPDETHKLLKNYLARAESLVRKEFLLGSAEMETRIPRSINKFAEECLIEAKEVIINLTASPPTSEIARAIANIGVLELLFNINNYIITSRLKHFLIELKL